MRKKTQRSAKEKITINDHVAGRKRRRQQPTTTFPSEQFRTVENSLMTSDKPRNGKPSSVTQESPAPQLFANALEKLWWDGTRTMAASYIEMTAQLWKNALTLQESFTDWTKETPCAVLFASQYALTRQWVDGSADMARRLWRIQKEATAQPSVKGTVGRS